MKRQFDQLNLNENEPDIMNLFFDQEIHHHESCFQSTMCEYLSTTSVNHAPYRSCLPLNSVFKNDADRARYFAILNYLKDFSICASPIQLGELQMAQLPTANTVIDTDTDGCWKVYDSEGHCFCC